jgi:hypothetical protein
MQIFYLKKLNDAEAKVIISNRFVALETSLIIWTLKGLEKILERISAFQQKQV